jgi:putative nucleotidyltransferase with HDIG domain
MADLRIAEEEGQESQFVPLVLLGKNLDLSLLQIFTWDKASDDKMRVRMIIGEQERQPDPQLLDEARRKQVCITQERKERGTAILVPLVTVRQTTGVLYAESRSDVDANSEDVRLLLAFATQTAYFLESLALDLRVKELYINTIRAISRALDSKDQFTSAHSELSLDHVEKFGRMCGLDREQIESLHVGALLHDIGKIGVPDSILAKDSNLTGKEYEIIKNHPVIGSDIVRGLPFPEDVKMIILHHHERYDGTGYPDGLKGYEIPLLVRIFSILDVYEALIGYRPYRDSLDRLSAADSLIKGSGTQFDPHLLDIFVNRILLLPEGKPG